jgi:hypothetical protein
MQLAQGTMTDIRLDVREAMENRARMLKAMGYECVDGEWVDAKSRRTITHAEIRTLYAIGDQSLNRKACDSRWPWPSTYVPF